ncbi:MAG: hypothetical protein CMM93_06080 [Rickettsiales bacterium]|nr:hypothetical protein [Rickettsiales bacterium]
MTKQRKFQVKMEGQSIWLEIIRIRDNMILFSVFGSDLYIIFRFNFTRLKTNGFGFIGEKNNKLNWVHRFRYVSIEIIKARDFEFCPDEASLIQDHLNAKYNLDFDCFDKRRFIEKGEIRDEEEIGDIFSLKSFASGPIRDMNYEEIDLRIIFQILKFLKFEK